MLDLSILELSQLCSHILAWVLKICFQSKPLFVFRIKSYCCRSFDCRCIWIFWTHHCFHDRIYNFAFKHMENQTKYYLFFQFAIKYYYLKIHYKCHCLKNWYKKSNYFVNLDCSVLQMLDSFELLFMYIGSSSISLLIWSKLSLFSQNKL